MILSIEMARARRVGRRFTHVLFAFLHSALREIAIIPILEMCKLSQKREVSC